MHSIAFVNHLDMNFDTLFTRVFVIAATSHFFPIYPIKNSLITNNKISKTNADLTNQNDVSLPTYLHMDPISLGSNSQSPFLSAGS